MKSFKEYLICESEIKIPQIHPSLSKETNLDCVLFLCDCFYNEYTTNEIRKTLNNIAKWRCPLSHANNSMSEFLQNKLNEWVEDNDYEWNDNINNKNDLEAINDLKDGYFNDDDFFWDMPTKEEFKKLQKQKKK